MIVHPVLFGTANYSNSIVFIKYIAFVVSQTINSYLKFQVICELISPGYELSMALHMQKMPSQWQTRQGAIMVCFHVTRSNAISMYLLIYALKQRSSGYMAM